MKEKIKYKPINISNKIPEELRSSISNKLNQYLELEKKYFENKFSNDTRSIYYNASAVNFTFGLITDDRMIPVFKKLFELNPAETINIFPDSILMTRNILDSYIEIDGIRTDKATFFESISGKMKALEEDIAQCEKLMNNNLLNPIYKDSFYSEEVNRSGYIGKEEHDRFIDSFRTYISRLNQVLGYYKYNKEEFEALSYITVPISQKKNKDVLWAKKLKYIFQNRYGKALNKEIGCIMTVLFGDNNAKCYEAEYINKTTEKIKSEMKKLKKQED